MPRSIAFLISSSIQVFAILVAGIIVQVRRLLVRGILTQELSFQKHVPVTGAQTGTAFAGEPSTLTFF